MFFLSNKIKYPKKNLDNDFATRLTASLSAVHGVIQEEPAALMEEQEIYVSSALLIILLHPCHILYRGSYEGERGILKCLQERH